MKKYLAIFLVIFLTSCTLTHGLWMKNYKENFQHFLVSNDGNFVVFIGKSHHYILHDDSGILKQLLASGSLRRHLFIDVERSHLNLNLQNHLTGHVTVESYFHKLPRRDYEFLRALGFRSIDNKALALKLKISGGRYLPRHDLGSNLPRLSRVYVIPIYYESGALGNFAKVALTPITVAADATLLLGKAILLPFRGTQK